MLVITKDSEGRYCFEANGTRYCSEHVITFQHGIQFPVIQTSRARAEDVVFKIKTDCPSCIYMCFVDEIIRAAMHAYDLDCLSKPYENCLPGVGSMMWKTFEITGPIQNADVIKDEINAFVEEAKRTIGEYLKTIDVNKP